MAKFTKFRRRKTDRGEPNLPDTSLVMSLALFVILLAFFIVLNGVSEFSKPKVDQAFNSLNIAFSTSILDSEFKRMSTDDREAGEDGRGDALKAMQGTLRSILPNLNMVSEPHPDGGRMMAVRITKDQFENVADVLFPLFARILAEGRAPVGYTLEITSYVRDPLAEDARQSFAVLHDYLNAMGETGLDRRRLSAVIETGNPAWLMLYFKMPEAPEAGA